LLPYFSLLFIQANQKDQQQKFEKWGSKRAKTLRAPTLKSGGGTTHRCNKRFLRFLFRSHFLRFLTFFIFFHVFFIKKKRWQMQRMNM